jgi:hypothetical protein
VRVNKEWCQNTVLLVPVSICRVCKGQESTFSCKGFSLLAASVRHGARALCL